MTTVDMNGVPGLAVAAPGSDRRRVLIHLHGGGFTTGSSLTHRALAVQLSLAAGAPVLLVDYRLAPEHPFPAARDDAITAFRWTRAQGHPCRSIAFGGDSAGAHVALSALLALRDVGEPLPAALVMLSPWLDLTQSGESMQTRAAADPLVSRSELADCARHYLAECDRHDPLVSPLAADLRGLPPVLTHVGDDEILLSDAVRFTARARSAGVDAGLSVWPEMWHVFHAWAPELPEAITAITQLGEHLRRHTGSVALEAAGL